MSRLIPLAFATLASVLASLAAAPPPARAASPCPAHAPLSLPNANPRAARVLVPLGATSVQLCRYRGLNAGPPPQTLERARVVRSAATIERLTRRLDGLPRLRSGIHCPMDDGSEVVAIFRYRGEPADPVRVGLSGCELVANGRVTRTAASPEGALLLRLLASLV